MKTTSGSYIILQDWMLKMLPELDSAVAFAVVYGYNVQGKPFYQSPKAIAEWCKTSVEDAKGILEYLVDNGLLLKSLWDSDAGCITTYRVNAAVLPPEIRPTIKKTSAKK